MIKHIRVDHRLLHGQVVFKWSKVLNIDCILIANDNVATDSIRMAALRMAKPSNCKLVIKNIADSINVLKCGVSDKYKLLIITESIEDVFKLASNVDGIKSINIGGTMIKEGRKQISKAVFVSDKDIEMVKELDNKGIKMEIQMVPDDMPVDILSLI